MNKEIHKSKTSRINLPAVILAAVMLLTVVPLTASAASETLDLTNGNIVITDTGYSVGGASEIQWTDGYVIESSVSPSASTIQVISGTHDITLNNVTINASGSSSIRVEPGAQVTLMLTGDNTLTGGGGFAAISVAPAYDAQGNYSEADSASLTLTGGGTLKAAGGDGLPGNQSGSIGYGGGAGIGGDGQTVSGDGVDFGTIIISNEFTGTLITTGGAEKTSNTSYSYGGGAGIGSGGMNGADYYWGSVYGNISIHNGSIEASSNGSGAGIGGGSAYGFDTVASQINVTISDGTVTSTGGILGAGIGGGSLCDGGIISISGGLVTAQAGANDGSMGAAGIGGGDNAAPSSVTITGGTISAVANGGAAGIGGGTNTTYSYVFDYDNDVNGNVGNKGIIAISGENTTVYAYGGTGTGSTGTFGGAGIGSGYPTANNQRSVAFDISVTDQAKVYTHGGYHAQAIGYGFRPNTSNPDNYYTGYGITLELDDTVTLWALNADFRQPALVAPTVHDASPITYSSGNRYLVRYTDADPTAVSASSAVAVGHLNTANPTDSVVVGWSFSTPVLTLTLNGADYSFTTDAAPTYTEITGNWAVLPTTFYTVRYDANGGAGNYEVTDIPFASDYTVLSLADTGITRSGYTFIGWNTAADGDGVSYNPGNVITINGNITLYAQWKVSGGLDKENHFAYIVGYPDGTVRPRNNITRAEAATIFFRLLTQETRMDLWTKTNDYSDVKSDDWYNNAISTLTNGGILLGYPDGAFVPNGNITRAEFAAIATRFDAVMQTGNSESVFSDTSGHWAESAIELAAQLGYVTGYGDGTFRPDNLITRAEVATLLNNVLNRHVEAEEDMLDDMVTWPDNTSDKWYYLAVQEATNSHYFERITGGIFETWTEIRNVPNWALLEIPNAALGDINY